MLSFDEHMLLQAFADRWLICFAQATGLAVTIAFVVLAALVLWPLGPWNTPYLYSAPHDVTGQLRQYTYTRADTQSTPASPCIHVYDHPSAVTDIAG